MNIKLILKSFFFEILSQGKMLVGYLLIANPWLTSYPMLVGALQAVAANPTKENAVNAIGQAVMALGAGHRIVKILQSVFAKVIKG